MICENDEIYWNLISYRGFGKVNYYVIYYIKYDKISLSSYERMVDYY